MAKTKHVRDDILYSRFVNSVYGTGANLVGSYASDTDRKWQGTTVYKPGDFVEPTAATTLWRCIVGGTTGATEPAWGTPSTRGTVTDGSVTWERFDGHLHDGRDADGSAPKILLDGGAEVAGVLPVANIGDHNHDGAGNVGKIVPANEISGFYIGTVPVKITATYLDTEVTADVSYMIMNGWAWLYFPHLTGNSKAGNHNLAIAPADPVDGWNATTGGGNLAPSTIHFLPVIGYANGTYCIASLVTGTATGEWDLRIATPTTVASETMINAIALGLWPESTDIGIADSTVMYKL